ncbi:sugar ABC transporter ATP-binding protein [Lacrimispora celerecrescens]|uniref:Ribose transport system ATP-binding protein n=1 Tax=[Clostridium] celerecrescens 18A TaxID=1286362 RepID=A0A2M8Z4A4_9FIRM|nr:sugar ABC transporter ATP-binding protein [Lacrimispora celerecrescens]PJJ28271.1 ribose transport system ATP-binding protein [[Clostridium] celerecrescens 18A]
MKEQVFVALEHISKSFPGVKALNDVSINFSPGRVHVLLGENGAGKSTIIKIISGVYQSDEGNLIVRGNKERFENTRESLGKGISVIHQELSVIPDLTIAENIFLGREPKTPLGLIDKQKMNQEAGKLLESLGMQINPKTFIRKLANGDKQMVEIARAVSQNSSMVIMDEPTSSLSEKEVGALFKVIKSLKKENVAVIYISHRLKEIREIGDDITILRDGKVVATLPLSQISEEEMINKMVGREMKQFYFRSEHAVKDEIVLSVENLGRGRTFHNVTFQLRRGEILGVAGLIGAGRTEVMRTVFGADAPDSGSMFVYGRPYRPKSVKDGVASGIGLVPEDRRGQGLLLEKNVAINTTISSLFQRSRKGLIDFAWEKAASEEYVKKMGTKTPGIRTRIKNLSGGNQQKVVIARWLLAGSRILIMDEPTRGIDVNAKAEIYNLMKEFVEAGGSIIMVSSDLPEILGVADRIMIMREGTVSGFIDTKEASEEKIMGLASISTESSGRENE